MSAPADHVLLRPFNDVTKWAKCALLQADGSLGDDYQQVPLSRSSQSLLREGERALRRLAPLLEKPSPQLSDFLRDLALRNSKRHKFSTCRFRFTLTVEQMML